ncbi:15425_t:CDS:2 [Funneliformis geosporum]|nr:15425_t:CDS:2 [Funneliformis geosporum]
MIDGAIIDNFMKVIAGGADTTTTTSYLIAYSMAQYHEFSTPLISNLSYQPQINNTFESHEEFVDKIKNYAYELRFTIRLGKVEYNGSRKTNSKESEENSSTITVEKKLEKEHYYALELIILNQKITQKVFNGLWYIINMKLIHNHHMVDENHQYFMFNE